MRVCLVSDTHMQHDALAVEPCDLFLHAGDATLHGQRDEWEAFCRWVGALPARHKVITAGNHDFCVESVPEEAGEVARAQGVTLLLDEGVTVEGLRIWGSPISPTFCHMAFNRDRGRAIRAHWARIPAGVDVLVTHGPPKGLGDRVSEGDEVGCEDLLDRVLGVRPRVHAFGHIHEARGEYALPGVRTRFLNVASCTRWPMQPRAPVVLEL
ncbi:MAG: metallophosphatase domain-containing protein [Deltaproteobacteria bacterium]|nr:metallophosphatase domain-containing protein [Deltaproteobacteria bacterium]